MIPLDDKESSFKQEFEGIPWLSLPVLDKTCAKLVRYFELSSLPIVVVIGLDGKIVHPNVAEVIEDHGRKAYPFTPEKFDEIEELEKIKRDSQTLESVLVSEDSDFVIGKVRVSELVEKKIFRYFSAHWCPPCRAFLPKLIVAYHEIKAKDDKFEVIFIYSNRDQASFDEFFSTMPWLAIPFGDKRKGSLSRLLKIQGIPALVVVGSTGMMEPKISSLITMQMLTRSLRNASGRLRNITRRWPRIRTRVMSREKMKRRIPRKAGLVMEMCVTKHK
ncbi:probable nucleoredoxin 1, partial [Olea europaea subsp. europaea]